MLSVIMLSVIMLSVIMPSVIMLNVLAPEGKIVSTCRITPLPIHPLKQQPISAIFSAEKKKRETASRWPFENKL